MNSAGKNNNEAATAEKPLTPRELEIIVLIAKDFTNEKIAELLFRSVSTIKKHRENIYRKTKCDSPAKVLAYVLIHKLANLELITEAMNVILPQYPEDALVIVDTDDTVQVKEIVEVLAEELNYTFEVSEMIIDNKPVKVYIITVE